MRATSFRSCQNIINAYVSFVEQKASQGWKPYLVTFQSIPLKGSRPSILRQMQRQITRVYEELITRVQRHPKTKNGSMYVPIFLGSPDLPVFKWDKNSTSDVTINDGLHYHLIALLPPLSRIKDLKGHFIEDEKRYLNATCLTKIDVEPIKDDLAKTAHYAFKGVETGRIGYDDTFLVLPCSISELPNY